MALAAPAATECRAQRSYTQVSGGYWGPNDSLLVPAGSGTVSRAVTTTETRSITSTVTAELGITTEAFVAEANAELGTSFAVNATVAKGVTTTVTAPASDADQMIRHGVFRQKVRAEIAYYGCGPSAPPTRTAFVYGALPAAGVERL